MPDATHLVVEFADPITLDLAQHLEDELRVITRERGVVITDMYAAYDDGFGSINKTDIEKGRK